jgi:hypothetical protein
MVNGLSDRVKFFNFALEIFILEFFIDCRSGEIGRPAYRQAGALDKKLCSLFTL